MRKIYRPIRIKGSEKNAYFSRSTIIIMKKIISSIFICFSFQLACFAQYVEKDVAKGMILNYEVQEAKINYKLKATVQEWNSNGNVKIQWQTSGAKKMKGVTTFPFESLDKASEMKVKLKPGNEQLTNGAIRWFAPNNYFDELFNDLGFVTATIDDNEVHNLRKIADEVFGEENFVAQIVRKSR
jgi:hypothetical protein